MRKPTALDSALLRAGARVASACVDRALAVLTFHRVLPRRDPLLPGEPDAADFSSVVDLLATHFNVLALSDAVALLKRGQLPPRAVCITLDDGYANNYTIARPILAARGLPATVFVATGFLDGGRMFNDTVIEAVRRAPLVFDLTDIGLGSYHLVDDATRVRAINEIIRQLKHQEPAARSASAAAIAARAGLTMDDGPMMSREQLRQLHRAGIEIGAHTSSHPILTSLDDDSARREIEGGRRELEAIIGSPVALFAFPNGKPGVDYDRRHVGMVAAAGFEAAFSTAWGTAGENFDTFQLPRIAPWGESPLRYALQIVGSYRQHRYARV